MKAILGGLRKRALVIYDRCVMVNEGQGGLIRANSN